jgi:Putative zinc-finger
MGDNASDFRGTLLELIDTSPEPGDHPTPDQWLAYQRGELPAEEEARLQEHLGRCRDCFDLAAGAAAFAEPDEELNPSEELATAALWRELRPQLDPVPDNVRPISAGARPRSQGFHVPTTLAASFLVALLGLTGWNLQMHSKEKVSQTPQAILSTIDLSGGERLPASKEWTVSKGPRVFEIRPDEELPAYRWVLRDTATGREEWRSEESSLNEDGVLLLYFPPGQPPGHYRLQLTDASGRHVVQESLLHVTE